MNSRRLLTVLLLLSGLAGENAIRAQQPVPGVVEDLETEMMRFSPVGADVAHESFAIQDGYSLQLVASEPLVSDPVDACFDARGRMYVAEMHGYPYSAEVRKQQPEPIGKKDAGIIRLLEDTDNDGVFDKSVVFADQISWPTSVCCWDDGLFVLAPSVLYYFKDTDGDDIADVRREVLSGFPRANVQGLANNMKWTLDNRITFSGGTNGGELSQDGEVLGSLRVRDVAFDPRTETVEFRTGGRQFGMGVDDWGNRFVCTNSNHIQHIVFEQADLETSDFVRVPDVIRNIAAEGAAAPVFRTSPPEPWRIVRTRRRAADPSYNKRLPPTELVPIGFFTSATGVTIVRGDASDQLHGMALIGDVGGNLVHRKSLTPEGASFIARRVDEDVEFITSTDTWFRPVNFVNSPDGCVYILDMYRETIEHPASIPEDIKAHVDLESGHDRGRIWRIAPPGWERRPIESLAELSSSELVGQLNSTNGWNRTTAQRLLYERQDHSIIDALRDMVTSDESALGRLHAAATLDGLRSLSAEDVAALLDDPDPRNQSFALQVWRRSHAEIEVTEALQEQLMKLVSTSNPRVQCELALSLRWLEEPFRSDLWMRLAIRESFHDDVKWALLLAATDDQARQIANLASRQEGLSRDQRSLVLSLVDQIGTRRDPQEAISLLRLLFAGDHFVESRRELLTRLGAGLRERSSSLLELASQEGVPADVAEMLEEAFNFAAEQAGDPKVMETQRLSAIALLAHGPADTAINVLGNLLTPQTSQRLQKSAITALRGLRSADADAAMLANWNALSPSVRTAAVDALLSSLQGTKLLLEALRDGRIQRSDLRSADRDLLLNHPRGDIRESALVELGTPGSADRAEVIAQYKPALAEQADTTHGAGVFKKVCAACHRLGDEGAAVGPDLVSVANKSPEDLLIALLDPGREAQPQYASYTILTTDGRVVSGLIAAESAQSVTLRRAEGKEDTVRREDIEVMNASGTSLMPVGLEKDLTPRDIADVIGLLKSLATAPSNGED